MTEGQPFEVGWILSGPLFNEPMRVETVQANGPASSSCAASPSASCTCR